MAESGGTAVAATHFRSGDVKKSFEVGMPIAFLYGCRKGV